MVCTHATETNPLSFFFYTVHKHVFTESAVVGVIILNLDAMIGTLCFPENFGLKCLHPVGGLLKIHKSDSRVMVNKDRCKLITRVGKPTLELCNETGAVHST